MGGCLESKPRSSDSSTDGNTIFSVRQNQNRSVPTGDASEDNFDEMEIRRLRKELGRDKDDDKILGQEPERDVFLLNHLLMSVMFYINHTNEIRVFKQKENKINQLDKELNQKLLLKENMQCIKPDIILEIVAKYIAFQPQDSTKPLQSLGVRRLFVINDNFEALLNTPNEEASEYSSIDKPNYVVQVEYCQKKGYVKLIQHSNLKRSSSSKSIDELVVEQEPKPGPSSSPDDNDENYDYITISELRTPKPLEIDNRAKRRDTLPKSCFLKEMKIKPEHIGKSVTDIRKMPDDEKYNIRRIISSEGYMNYFKNNVFPHSLGKSLGFTQEQIEKATSIPGRIFCTSMADDENKEELWEILPAMYIDWPLDHVYEFETRRRNRRIMKIKGKDIDCTWPTRVQIQKVKSMKCVVVPMGYYKKKGENAENPLEWEIHFPKAERYLECTMTNEQVRCYLFLLAFHKTFIEPYTHHQGLLPEHIRTHMFWEMEDNYRDWPEDRLGAKIKLVVNNLITKLGKSNLPDYFIQQKNLFENIPKRYLNFAQEKFHRLFQSPSMYFLMTLRNLKYTRKNYYPQFDFDDCKKILQESDVKFVHKEASAVALRELKVNKVQNPEQYQKYLQYEEERKKRMQPKNLKNEETKSTDDWNSWDAARELTEIKQEKVLEMFIKHFIGIHKKSLEPEFSATYQALFYLKLAKYLDNISLGEYKSEIELYIENTKIKLAKNLEDMPPKTPVRNSIQYFDKQVLPNPIIDRTSLDQTFNKKQKVVTAPKGNKKNKSSFKIKTNIISENVDHSPSPTSTKTVQFGP